MNEDYKKAIEAYEKKIKDLQAENAKLLKDIENVKSDLNRCIDLAARFHQVGQELIRENNRLKMELR